MNGAWEPVGPYGIQGGLSGGGPMEIYQGDLYLGGLIYQSAGNAGHALMRWDGTDWHQVGEGLQDASGFGSGAFKAEALLIHDDKLFVSGGFTYAGHVPSPRIATWDGVQWCSVGGYFGESGAKSMAVYNDTLYIGIIGDSLDGQPVLGVAKFIGSEYENNCSGITAVNAVERTREGNLVNMGSGQFVVRGIMRPGQLVILGATGQVVAQRFIHTEAPATQ